MDDAEYLRSLGNKKCACGAQQYAGKVRGPSPHFAEWRCVACSKHGGFIPKPGGNGKRKSKHTDLVARSRVTHCELCLRSDEELRTIGRWLEGHHIVEYSDRECSEPYNVMILCVGCHRLVNWMRTYVGKNEPDGDLLGELERKCRA